MSSLDDLLAQKEALEAQIEDIRNRQRADAIAQVKELIRTYDLTSDDLFGRGSSRFMSTRRGPGTPRYRDPVSGKTWTGQGRMPKWLEGKSKEDFAI
ncbi:MAG: H-NS histone family protein [Rhodocyclaceae bacterium]